jgi:hypothetical protein
MKKGTNYEVSDSRNFFYLKISPTLELNTTYNRFFSNVIDQIVLPELT